MEIAINLPVRPIVRRPVATVSALPGAAGIRRAEVLAAIARARDDVRRATRPVSKQLMREMVGIARRVCHGAETAADRELIASEPALRDLLVVAALAGGA
jgi:hypothetical protein